MKMNRFDQKLLLIVMAQLQIGPLRVRVPPSHRRAKGGADVPQRDQMGKEYNVRGTAGLLALVVVVSQKIFAID